jgi:aspartate kinase
MARVTPPLVLKVGGSCLLDLDDVERVAEWLRRRLGADGAAVVVVSALAGTTAALDAALRRLNHDPPPRITAGVLLHGDELCAGLLAAALAARGVDAEVAAGRHTGLVATGRPDRARLVRVDPAPLLAALGRARVAVVPGGQAVDAAGRPVMLGRNSADTSAVAAAVAVGAVRCDIFSAVPGIFTADPHLVADARPVATLGYAAAGAMTRAGAKVLHPDAVGLAERHGVAVTCRGWPPVAGGGTVVAGDGGVDAVVTASASRVWAAPAGGTRPAGVDGAVVVDEGGVAHLALPCGDEVEVPAGLDPRPALRLLTVIRGDAPVERRLVPVGRLAAVAADRHRALHAAGRGRPPVDSGPRLPTGTAWNGRAEPSSGASTPGRTPTAWPAASP